MTDEHSLSGKVRDFAGTPGTTPLRVKPPRAPVWRRYLELTKPKVVALITFTAIVGTLLASPGLPPLTALLWGNLGIALAAACAATLNHILDRRIDEQMSRTRARPLPTGQLTERNALVFAAVLGVSAMAILAFLVNLLTATLTFLSLIGYAVVYTVWLKRATSQNIVIGGAAGAAPPVLGWAAVTDSIDPNALLLFLIIFVWTPPHFWALAIARRDDYARAGIPMLPVVSGEAETRRQILLYSLILAPLGASPWLLGYAGPLYGIVAVAGGAAMISLALRIYRNRAPASEKDVPPGGEPQGAHATSKQMFTFSILYLFLLFAMLLADRLAGPLFGQVGA